MNNLKFIILSVMLLALSAAAHAQKISGKVSDAETGEPLPFASVGIEGTNIGVSSNLEGEFTLLVPESDREGKLVFNFLGYESQTVLIGSIQGKNIEVKLKPAVSELGEIVIRPVSAAEYVRQAMESREENYASRFTGNAYFRQVTTDKGTPLQFSEGYFQTYVPTYLDTVKVQQRLLLLEEKDELGELAFNAKRRKKKFEKAKRKAKKKGEDFDDEEARKKAEIVSMGMLSPAELIGSDPVRTLEGFLSAETLKDYNFEFRENTSYLGRSMVVISFKSKGKVKIEESALGGKQQGILYFDKETDALAAADYTSKMIIPAAIKPILYLAGYSIPNPSVRKQLRYELKNGKWLPRSIRFDLKMKLTRRYLFSKNEKSDLTAHMLVNFTGWQTENLKPIPKDKRFTHKKKMEDQVYPMEGIAWKQVNRIPLEK